MRFISASFIRSSSFFSRVSSSVSGGLVSSSFTSTLHKDLGGFEGNFTSNKVEYLVPSQSAGGSDDVKVLVISASGDNPRVGIGVENPLRSFDFKEIRDDNRGGELLIRGSRSTKGAETDDEVGRINFAIDSASFGKIDTSGSAAEIVALVDEVDETGIKGHMSLRIANAKTGAPSEILKLSQSTSVLNSPLDLNGTLSVDGSDINASTINRYNNTSTRIELASNHLEFYGNAYGLKISNTGIDANPGGIASLDFRVRSDNDAAAILVDSGDDTITLGSSADTHITASGNISASGTIIGSNLSGTNTGDQDLSSYSTIAQLNASSSALQSNIDGKQDTLTFGKSSGNALKSEEALTTNDVLLMGSSNVKGRTYSQFRSDINVEDGADVTDTTNVTAAGALMDSEVTNLAQVKAFDSSDYATAAQGTKADNAATLVQLNASSSALQSNIDGKQATLTFGKSSGNALKSEEALTTNDILLAGSTNIKGRTYAELKSDLSLNNVTNESKATMFTSPTFTGNSTFANITSSGNISASGILSIPGFSNVSASLAAASGGGGGDITGVTAGNGLTGGGSSGDVTLTVGAGTGVTVNSGDIAIGQDVSTNANVEFDELTIGSVFSSGDIKLTTNNTQITQVLSGGATRDLIGFDGDNNAVIGNPSADKVKLVGAVTASGDISSSGTITGNSIVGTLATAAQTNITSVGTLGSLTMGGDIDMDGQTLTMNSGQIDGAAEISSNAFRMGNGGVSTPALSFTSDSNTGIYAVGADTLGIAAGGSLNFSAGSTSNSFSKPLSLSVSDGDGAILSVTNTYSGITSADSYAIKAVGNTATGTPGSQNKAYGGHFTAGNTNGANPDTIALFAQGHEDGAPNSYAAIFSGSAGGIVGINTMEPTVELDVSGDGKFSGALEIGGISDVSASIAAAGGGAAATTYRTVIESSCYFGQTTLRYLPFNSLSEQTSFNYLSITPAAADGKLVSITMWPQSSGGSTVVGLHINSNATAATTNTQTISAGTPLTFTFSSNNTFSQNDEISFSVDPTNNINGLAAQIVLEYDL